jgi:hypothetical protein
MNPSMPHTPKGSRSRLAPRRRLRARVEALEGRALMAGGVAYNSATREILIEGTSSADVARVAFDYRNPLNVYDDQIVVSLSHDGHAHTLRLARASTTPARIVFRGYAGNDWFSNSTYIASIAYGSWGNDTLSGGSGIDVLYGEGDHDSLFGNAGNDWLYGGTGHDRLYGQAGNDTYGFSDAYAGYESDVVTEYVNGGTDTLDFGYLTRGVSVRLDLWYGPIATHANRTVWLSQAGLNQNFENVVGGQGNDYLVGNAQSNRLYGLGGHDTLVGLSGSDALFGGDGNDTLDGGRDGSTDDLWGGSGADRFVREQYRPWWGLGLVKKDRDKAHDLWTYAGDRWV